jgi:hypothetical protein
MQLQSGNLTMRTAPLGGERIELDAANTSLNFYDSSNDKTASYTINGISIYGSISEMTLLPNKIQVQNDGNSQFYYQDDIFQLTGYDFNQITFNMNPDSYQHHSINFSGEHDPNNWMYGLPGENNKPNVGGIYVTSNGYLRMVI